MILSVVMGLHWYKNKPVVVKKPAQERVSVRLDEKEGHKGDLDDMDDFDDFDDDELDDGPSKGKKASSAVESESEQVAAAATFHKKEGAEKEEEAESASRPVYEDEVLAYFAELKRTPFDTSPYTKMIEQLRIKAEEQIKALHAPKALHKTTQLNALYSASIVLGSQLVAVIDSKTYRTGEQFNDMKITDISQQLVVLTKDGDKFLIPKRGVVLSIAEDGSYSVNDTYFDK